MKNALVHQCARELDNSRNSFCQRKRGLKTTFFSFDSLRKMQKR